MDSRGSVRCYVGLRGLNGGFSDPSDKELMYASLTRSLKTQENHMLDGQIRDLGDDEKKGTAMIQTTRCLNVPQ